MMSGGRLVVLDRSGRAGKWFRLGGGAAGGAGGGQAALGRSAACHVRVLQPGVRPHHASLVLHAAQAVIRNVSDGETLVNGRAVSVAALRHNDVITIGDRSLRWEYDDPTIKRPLAAEPALPLAPRPRARPPRPPRPPRRATTAGPAREQAALLLHAHHRASMPGNAGGKQVAIVQPQRRDTSEQIVASPRSAPPSPRSAAQRSRGARADTESPPDGERPPRAAPRVSSKNLSLHNTTKATLWIESRKASPRKGAAPSPAPAPPAARPPRRAASSARKASPLRTQVLRKAQSARKLPVTKIQAPREIDHMKQAALMLMTGHTSKARLSQAHPARASPALVVKKGTPLRSTLRRSNARTGGKSVSILEITDADDSTGTRAEFSRSKISPLGSPLLLSPKKSAMKDPTAKRSSRKTESIKFDLSNLEDCSGAESGVSRASGRHSAPEDELALHYSDTSGSPSPRAGAAAGEGRRTLTPESPRARKSLRGSVTLQDISRGDRNDSSRYSRRTTATLTDQSTDTTVQSGFQTRTLSPRTSVKNLESYSIVDLVSIDSDRSAKSPSVYGSVGSTRSSSFLFGTPRTSGATKTRSTIDSNLLTSSTPYHGRARASTRSNSSPNILTRKASPNKFNRGSAIRRSKSLTTPENSEETQKHISINSTRISRASRSRSRINDSDLQFITMGPSGGDTEESPKTSRISRMSNKSMIQMSPGSKTLSPRTTSSLKTSFPRKNSSPKTSSPRKTSSPKTSIPLKTSSPKTSSPRKTASPKSSSTRNKSNLTLEVTLANSSPDERTMTPENRNSPPAIGTPVLSVQYLLDSSQSSPCPPRRTRLSGSNKRKNIDAIRSERKPARSSLKSKSFTTSVGRSLRSLRLSLDSGNDKFKTSEQSVTPKSAVKLVQEAVKNKHSTAKKPQSKRSIIDNLNDSDIVKQLFNSPVKRKLSQSMTEFSRSKMWDEGEDAGPALGRRSPSPRYALDHFVSPLSTPSHSPNFTGIKRLFTRNTSANDLRDVKGVKGLLRTPRTRKSGKNNLTDVVGVKTVFARSPRNRLSDVRVKEVFAASPKNDLRRVSGVKNLFQSQQKTKTPDLRDVRGVRNLFKRASAVNDLRNVSGVKQTLRLRSPRNDLTDVRGVRRMFRREKESNYHDVSGIEELFNESSASHNHSEALFDRLVGKPRIKAVYSKSFLSKRPQKQTKRRAAKSLHTSMDQITNNVEEWLEQELQKHLHKDKQGDLSTKANLSRELQKLATDTVEGTAPILTSRVRASTVHSHGGGNESKRSASQVYSAHTLPIKKRSFVEASLEPSKESKLIKLPIKKRAVLHSTPVQGRLSVTMNASELARVSPITSRGRDRSSQRGKQTPKPKEKRFTRTKVVQLIEERQEKETKPSPKSKGLRTTRVKESDIKHVEDVQPSPKSKRSTRSKIVTDKKHVSEVKLTGRGRSTRAAAAVATEPELLKSRSGASSADNVPAGLSRRSRNNTNKEKFSKPKREATAKSVVKSKQALVVQPSPKKTRGKPQNVAKPTRSTRHKTENVEVSNTKKRRKSLVITKKTPVLGPLPAAKATRKEKEKAASSRTKKAEITVEITKSPKRTRAKLVVSKSSPGLKPSAKSSSRRNIDSVIKVESPIKAQVSTRGRKNVQIPLTEPKSSRSRKVTEKSNEPKSTTSKSKPTNKRGRRAVDKSVDDEPPVKRGRNTKSENKRVQNSASPRKTRSQNKKTVESVPSAPAQTNLKKKAESIATVSEVRRGRKRKTTEDHTAVPSKISKTEVSTRGRKTGKTTQDTKKSPVKQNTVEERKSKKQQSKVEKEKQVPKVVATRNKRQAGGAELNDTKVQKSKVVKQAVEKKPQSAGEKKTTRGNKAQVQSTPPASGRSKRNAKITASPVKALKNTRSRRR